MSSGPGYRPARGDTLLIPTGPSQHLFVILNDPYGSIGEVVLVPICSIRRRWDTTCALHPGDHPFIRHPSYVEYRHGRIERLAVLQRGVANGSMVPGDPMDPPVLRAIRDGVDTSPQAKPALRKLLHLAGV